MACHTRDMIRHHRQRIIAKRRELFSSINYNNYVPEHLAKYSGHSHSCDYCSRRYERSKAKYDWKQDPNVSL